MNPRAWIAAGWIALAATVGLAVAGAVQTLAAVGASCVQPIVRGPIVPGQLVPGQLVAGRPGYLMCPGTGTELVWGLICAASAGVLFFSGLTCFFWAAHVRRLDQADRIRRGQGGDAARRHHLFD